jgi:hypothetical protein
MNPELEEDILDVVNATLGINTLRVSVQVEVAQSAVWRVLLQQLYPKILVTTRLPYASSVLPGIVTTV